MADGDQRLFVAVPLPPEAIADCAALIDEVRGGPLGRVPRWVHVPNLHFTVRFLGEDDLPEAANQQAAKDLTAAMRTGELRYPIAARFDLEQIANAHEMAESVGAAGRVVVLP